MSKERKHNWDVAAGVLLITGLIVAAGVFSFDVASPINHTDAAQSENLLGPTGDWLASSLFDALGYAVYVLMICWFVLVLLMFQLRDSSQWFLRLGGWLILVPCTAVLADLLQPANQTVSLCGAGGSIGSWLVLWLTESFDAGGTLLLLGGCLALGIFLALDFILIGIFRLFGKVLAAGWQISVWLMQHVVLPDPQFVRTGKPSTVKVSRRYAPQSIDDDADDGPSSIESLRIGNFSQYDEAEDDEEEEYSESGTLPILRLTHESEQDIEEDYELPSLSLLEDPEEFPYEEHDQQLRDRAKLLEKTFKDFELNVRVVGINTGPVITQYEIALETGLRLNKVTRLADDIALNLKVSSVRMVAPIPGKNTVGVEVPNEHRAIVHLKEVILASAKQSSAMRIPLFLGKDSEGRALVHDLATMPHLLIAGRTGTGKSVCLNTIILSVIMTRKPDEVKMLMIDPKRAELSEYADVPHLMHPVVTDMKKAEAILSWAVDEMEKRYDLLSLARVRNITSYNKLSRKEQLKRINPDPEEADQIPEQMPSIVIIVDEMADLMMTMKREVEGHIIRLAQKSRAAGIHLVVATQKPTVDVITGLIKSNLPARIAFQVSSRSDSRVVLDEMGADKLLGAGDMLFLQPGTSTLIRAQGTYTSDEEITAIVDSLEGEPEFTEELLQLGSIREGVAGNFHEHLRSRDDVYEQAIEIVVREGRGSVSLLQRALGIGYGRAARIIDYMAEDGIVGTHRGSNAREVIISLDEWEEMKEAGQLMQRA